MLTLVGEGEPAGDHHVISGGGGVGLAGEALAQRKRSTPRSEAGNDLGIVGGVSDDRHEGMVLGRRADHRRAADVDILDDLVTASALRDGLREGVEIDHDEVDRADAMLVHRRGVSGIVAHREKPAVDHRVKRLYAAVHHFGEAGQVGHIAHVMAHVTQGPGSSAGRNELDPVGDERGGERFEATLVGQRQERPADGYEVGHPGPSNV